LQRRDRLEQIINPAPGIQVGSYVENRGIDLYRLAKEKRLEGIIAKRKTSTYRPGKRSPDWLKIKARPQQEFVVCGFTEDALSGLDLDCHQLGLTPSTFDLSDSAVTRSALSSDLRRTYVGFTPLTLNSRTNSAISSRFRRFPRTLIFAPSFFCTLDSSQILRHPPYRVKRTLTKGHVI